MNTTQGTTDVFEAELLERAYKVTLDLAEFAMAAMREGIEGNHSAWNKQDAADWVTDVDVRIEQQVRAVLSEHFPTHRLIGEEQGSTGSETTEFAWYVDPIDGTCNFRHGIRWNSFSLALCISGEPVLGVVVDPYRNELFHARQGAGAYINHKAVHINTEPLELAGQVVMLELANHRYWPGMTSCLNWLSEQLVTARIMGSSALSVVHAGAGRAVGAAMGGSNPIDLAAAVLFARESGAVVIGRDGDTESFPKDGLVAGHPSIVNLLWRAAFQG